MDHPLQNHIPQEQENSPGLDARLNILSEWLYDFKRCVTHLVEKDAAVPCTSSSYNRGLDRQHQGQLSCQGFDFSIQFSSSQLELSNITMESKRGEVAISSPALSGPIFPDGSLFISWETGIGSMKIEAPRGKVLSHKRQRDSQIEDFSHIEALTAALAQIVPALSEKSAEYSRKRNPAISIASDSTKAQISEATGKEVVQEAAKSVSFADAVEFLSETGFDLDRALAQAARRDQALGIIEALKVKNIIGTVPDYISLFHKSTFSSRDLELLKRELQAGKNVIPVFNPGAFTLKELIRILFENFGIKLEQPYGSAPIDLDSIRMISPEDIAGVETLHEQPSLHMNNAAFAEAHKKAPDFSHGAPKIAFLLYDDYGVISRTSSSANYCAKSALGGKVKYIDPYTGLIHLRHQVDQLLHANASPAFDNVAHLNPASAIAAFRTRMRATLDFRYGGGMSYDGQMSKQGLNREFYYPLAATPDGKVMNITLNPSTSSYYNPGTFTLTISSMSPVHPAGEASRNLQTLRVLQ